jgi:hypothetical protein
MMERAADKTTNVKNRTLWLHHNKPIALWSQECYSTEAGIYT